MTSRVWPVPAIKTGRQPHFKVGQIVVVEFKKQVITCVVRGGEFGNPPKYRLKPIGADLPPMKNVPENYMALPPKVK